MHQHEFTKNPDKCDHCGGKSTTTCIWRPDDPTAPRPRPHSVVDDFDSLHDRVKELRAEQDKVMSASELGIPITQDEIEQSWIELNQARVARGLPEPADA